MIYRGGSCSFRRGLVLLSLATSLALSVGCQAPSANGPGGIPKRLRLTLGPNPGWATCVAYSPDGQYIASCHEEPPGRGESDDPQVKPTHRPRFDQLRKVLVWDAHTAKVQLCLNRGSITSSVSFTPDSLYVAGATGNMIRTWETATGKDVLALKRHIGVVRDLDVSRDGKLLVSGSDDCTVKVWDLTAGVCLHTLRTGQHPVRYVSISADGRLVASTGGEYDATGEIRVWDLATEKQVLSFGHDVRVGKVSFSPDSKHVAGFGTPAARDTRSGLVELWDLSTGKLVYSLTSHSAKVTCIALSQDGKRLASGSEDGTVILRDTATGEVILTLVACVRERYSTPRIMSVAFGPRGDLLATASCDGAVRIWDVEDGKAD